MPEDTKLSEDPELKKIQQQCLDEAHRKLRKALKRTKKLNNEYYTNLKVKENGR